MLDINEKNSHSDQIIFNKSVIEQHLKTHFTKERNNWTSPNVDKQTLSSNKTNVINAFTFEEPERKNSSYFNCHKNLNVKLDKSFSDKNS